MIKTFNIIGLVSLVAVTTAHASEWTTSGTGTAGTHIAMPTSCALAMVANDDDRTVTIDWGCVEKQARQYRERKTAGYNDVIAHVLQTIKDGEAKSQ